MTDQTAEAVERLKDAFGREPAQRDQSPLGNDIRALLADRERLRLALEDVRDPMARLRRELPEGARLSSMAHGLANSVNYIQSIAEAALNTQGEG